MNVDKDTVVTLSLTLTDAAGTARATIHEREPLTMLVGHSGLPAALDAHLIGLAPDTTFEVTLEAADAYGLPDPKNVIAVHRTRFSRDAWDRLAPGQRVDGSQVKLDGVRVPSFLVVALRGSRAEIDTNHPLAGETITFTGKIISVREAHPTEIEHGHVHAGGHHDHH